MNTLIDYDIEIDDIIDVLNENDIPGVAYCSYEFRDGVRYIVVEMTEAGISDDWKQEIKTTCHKFGEHDLIFEDDGF